MVNKGSASLPRVPHAAQLRNEVGGHSPLHLDANAGGKVESEVQERKETERRAAPVRDSSSSKFISVFQWMVFGCAEGTSGRGAPRTANISCMKVFGCGLP